MTIAIRTRALIFLAGLIFLLAGTFAHAQQDPGALVQQTFDTSIQALDEHQEAIRKEPRVAYTLMEEILAPHVDFSLMSRLVLARHWADADPEQRERFISVFRENLLRTYAKVLSDNIDEALRQIQADRELLRVLPVGEPDSRGRVTVRTQLRFNGDNIPIDYRMYQRDGEWKVFDVVIEEISFVMNYRSEYGAELQRADLDTLIQRLRERNRRAWQEE